MYRRHGYPHKQGVPVADPQDVAISVGTLRGAEQALQSEFVGPESLDEVQKLGHDVTADLVREWGDGDLAPGLQALGAELLTMSVAARLERARDGGGDVYGEVREAGGDIWTKIKEIIDGDRWFPNH
jgi:hypothetical protein